MLKMILQRVILAKGFTIGKLYVQTDEAREPAFYCWTLEPEVREKKIKGVTAIPEGTYEIVMSYSNHFRKQMPFLVNVPNFVGVMIHPGNTKEDTQGCILVGVLKSASDGKLVCSTDTFNRMKCLIRGYASHGGVLITITNSKYGTNKN